VVARKELARLKAEIEAGRFAPTTGPTFGDAVATYLRRGGDGRFLAPILDKLEAVLLADVVQTLVDEVAVALYPTASAATRNRQVYTPVSAVLRASGIRSGLERPKGHAGQRRVRWLKPEEADAVCAAARVVDLELAALLVSLLYTGMRLGEALSVTRDMLDLDAGEISLPKTKNGEPRGVYLPPYAVTTLRAHVARIGERARLFRFTKGQRLYQKLARATSAAGVPWFTFHVARHTWATWMRRYAGVDELGLIATGAWSDRKSVGRYSHTVIAEEAKRAALLPTPSLEKVS
jgi:integrase